MTSSYVAFQHDRILTALDPVTGDTLWIRDDFAGGCDLFGDEERLVVAPTSGNQATVLNAVDGSTLGQRAVPDRNNRIGTWGCSVVLCPSDHPRYPNMPVVIFPGNVGDDSGLVQALKRLISAETAHQVMV